MPQPGIVYQWVTGSDAATDPMLAVDASQPPGTANPPPYANNVYIAWASVNQEPANTNPYVATGFNPDRAELVVGTPSPVVGTEAMAFSGVKTVNVGGNFGPQKDSDPQLVISNTAGQITLAWDDFGTGATASTPYDNLMSSLVQPGESYGFATSNTFQSFAPASTATVSNWTQPTFATGGIYFAGPQGSDADPTSIAVADVNGDSLSDIVVSDKGIGSIGELVNQGAGAFPATALAIGAGLSPDSVVLGNVTGHTTNINDAAVANFTGGSVLTNPGNGRSGRSRTLSLRASSRRTRSPRATWTARETRSSWRTTRTTASPSSPTAR